MVFMESTKKISSALGTVVAAQRRARGLSQEELAFAAGLHRTYISLLERGLKSPTLNTLSCISSALAIRASDLVRGAEELLGKEETSNG